MHLCKALKVSRAGYYKWLNRKPSAKGQRLEKLIEMIVHTYNKFNGIYGYRRITIYLNHYLGAKVNHKCVHRLMKLLKLKAVIHQKRYNYKPHTPNHVAENILNRAFQEEYKPMEVLLTDVTELPYGNNSKAYLSAILDYGVQKIIAFKLSHNNNNALVRDTFSQIENQLIPNKTLIHSDRGFQYTSHFFREYISRNDVLHSMSRVGKCIDNGPMESFWGILKSEMPQLEAYDTFEELNDALQSYIEFYNMERVPLSMGLRIPA